MSDTYQVKYKKTGSSSVQSSNVRADSASQAKEQIKSRYNGNVSIISAVKK